MFAADNPDTIVCICNGPFENRGQIGFSAEIDIVCRGNKTAGLATIIDKDRAEFFWKALLKAFKDSPGQIERLIEQGPMGITKWTTMCGVPIDREGLNMESVEQGVRMYLGRVCPKLKDKRIVWLPEEQQNEFEEFVHLEAVRTAEPQTRQQRAQIICEDIKPL